MHRALLLHIEYRQVILSVNNTNLLAAKKAEYYLEASSSNPSIAVSVSNVYVVWTNVTPGPPLPGPESDVLYRRSTDREATFGSVINLSNNAEDSFNPSIAGVDNNVYVE